MLHVFFLANLQSDTVFSSGAVPNNAFFQMDWVKKACTSQHFPGSVDFEAIILWMSY